VAVNPKRGELQIVLGETKYQGRVTLDVVMRIERQMGRGIVKIAQAMSNADISVSDILTILTPVIRAGGNDVKEKDLHSVIWEAGLTEGIRVCGEVIAIALGHEDDEGNVEGAAQLL